MTASFLPPPPEPVFSTAKRLEVYQQMLSDLENQAAYQQEAIAFHTQSLESIKAKSEITAQELESCRGIIKSLKASTTIAQTVEASSNQGYSEVKEEIKAQAASKTKPKAEAKSQRSSKTSVKPTAPKTESATKVETKAIKPELTKSQSKTKSEVKAVAKPVSTLPASEVIDQFESITAMVLDFVKKQEGVISVIDLIKYAYPKGLKTEAEIKKVSSSLSSVLINQTKKGILERTVPGKYMWVTKNKNTVS
jgi:chromosome segregation ATPase